jgi:hypothetical protein
MVRNSKEKEFITKVIIDCFLFFIIIVLQMMLRTLIHGARQIVTVTRNSNEKFLCGKDMHNIGIIKADTVGLSLMIEK